MESRSSAAGDTLGGAGGGGGAAAVDQYVDELAEGIGQVGRREDQQRAPALLDRALELDQPRHAQREGILGMNAGAGLVQRVEQKAIDPGAIGLGVGDEHVMGTDTCTTNAT